MAITAKIDVKEQDVLGSLRGFFEDLLKLDEIKAILVPQHLPAQNRVMPTLVTEPDHLNAVDPLQTHPQAVRCQNCRRFAAL